MNTVSPRPHTAFLTRPEGRIAYEDTGTPGPLLVLIPGIGDLRAQFRRVREPLAAAGHRVVTIDLRGHGDSDATFSGYNGALVGDDVLALIEYLDAGPAVILGNSIGAGSGVYAAVERPDLVAGLVLIGGFTRGPDLSWPMRALVGLLMGGPWRVAVWMGLHDRLFPSARPDDHAAHRDAIRQSLSRPAHAAAFATMMGADHAHSAVRMDRVRCPSRFVMGSADSDFPDPEAEATEVAARLGGDVVMIDGAGHYPHLECPDAFLDAVLPFLAQTSAKA